MPARLYEIHELSWTWSNNFQYRFWQSCVYHFGEICMADSKSWIIISFKVYFNHTFFRMRTSAFFFWPIQTPPAPHVSANFRFWLTSHTPFVAGVLYCLWMAPKNEVVFLMNMTGISKYFRISDWSIQSVYFLGGFFYLPPDLLHVHWTSTASKWVIWHEVHVLN